MASGPGQIAHRAVTNIRSNTSQSPGQPSTPPRAITSTFGSPSSLRAEEDLIVIEIGSRFVRVGFAGDHAPKAKLQLGPNSQRRVGDHRIWLAGYEDDWRNRDVGEDWGKDYEIWQDDIRKVDVGLVEAKLDRLLREAFFKYLLIDSRPRRMALVVPSSLPLPLLTVTLDILFNRFQAPMVSLLSSATMCTVAAGTRSGLIIDLGWNETVVTSVYEYREVQTTRSVRAGKHVTQVLHNALRDMILQEGGESQTDKDTASDHVLSFEECEEIACRLLWCKGAGNSRTAPGPASPGLPTVQEQDETEADMPPPPAPVDASIEVPLKSTKPPRTLAVQFSQFAEVCETAFFERRAVEAEFDDEELPVHLLVYRHLLHLPIDVRAICMSRILFTGGCSKILGIKGRIVDEVSAIAAERGWSLVSGQAVEQLKNNPKLRLAHHAHTAEGGPTTTDTDMGGMQQDGVWHDAANAAPERDMIEEHLHKNRKEPPHGEFRVLDTLGPWSGGSLTCQLKVMAIANVERDAWLQQGINGASRPNDVDVKAQHRQSLGPGVIRGTGSADRAWTLGIWGSV